MASDQKPNDTAFRRTWDRAAAAERAASRERKAREEGRARHEAKLAGKKYVPRAPTPPDAKETESRSQRLDVASLVGKRTLVPAGAGVGKRGRSAGFYCEACDLTFKDNLQLVDHYNSRQHLVAIGESGEVRKVGVDEVRARLAWLKRKKEDEEEESRTADLGERLERAARKEEEEREEKRRKRAEKRRKGGRTATAEQRGDDQDHDHDDGATME